MLYANYHTHTKRCGHAGNFDEESYIKAAVGSGFKVLGFADHCPWNYSEGFSSSDIRMSMGALPEYINTIHGLAEKYKDRIRIYTGLECEYYPDNTDILDMFEEKLDYIILGAHFMRSEEYGDKHSAESTEPADLYKYMENNIAAIESGRFRYLNHPDIMFSSYPSFDKAAAEVSREIARCAKRTGTPVEYNIYGIVKFEKGTHTGIGYPCPGFWEIAAEEGCTAIIGCDAHDPELLANVCRIEKAQQYLNSLGIHVIDRLPGLE